MARLEWLRFLVLPLLALPLAACDSDGLRLSVDLRTDLVPGAEFYYVETAIETRDGAEVQSPSMFNAHRGLDLITGERIATLRALPEGNYVVWVRLRDARYEPMLERRVDITLRANYSVTVVAARTCASVACGASETCLDGQCVDPSCTPETPDSCPPPACVMDTDCQTPVASCAVARCVAGSCFAAPGGADMCEADQFCRPETGCADYPSLADAGVVDAGDAGMLVPPAALLEPPRGASTGDPMFEVTDLGLPAPARPKMKWTATGGDYLSVELSDTDTFANVLVTLDTVGNVDHLIPSAPLAAMRWHWRVRACRGTPAVRDCSDPSPSSYFVVGRTEIDFNPPDGIRDVVVGGPGSVPDGAIELASASQSGVSMTSDTFVPSAGLSTDSTLGWALAAGDFRARGVNQLVVSAVTESTGSSHGGAVVIVDPGASGTSTQQSTLRSPRSLPNQRFGSSIAVPGDLDGDGYDELVVGEPGEPVGGVEGRVYVFFGSGTGLSTTPTITLSPVPPVPSDSGFGAVVARIGDFDNDGYSDFAIGEPDPSGSTGRAFIVFGRPDRTTIASTMEAFTTPTTAASGARFGAAIVGVGDIDRDGTDDVLIGAPGNNDAGSVYVYANANDAMPRAQIDAAGAMMGADFGASLASLGDVDLDGTVDFVIGAPGWAGTGQVFVYLSPSLDSSITSTQTLPGTGNRFGHCIVGRPYDRSGTPLLVTAPGDDGSATNGEVLGYSLSGTPARFGATYSLSITSSGHRIGWSCL